MGELPGVLAGSLIRARKGIFGLADAPRRWWLRQRRCPRELGFRQCRSDPALFTLHAADGTLAGVVGTHVDDLLSAGSKSFVAKLEEVAKQLGFGKWESAKQAGGFIYCGRRVSQNVDGTVRIDMKDYTKTGLATIFVPLQERKEG